MLIKCFYRSYSILKTEKKTDEQQNKYKIKKINFNYTD